jgi:hypothetical protein
MPKFNSVDEIYALMTEEDKQELRSVYERFVTAYTMAARQGDSFFQYSIEQRGDLYYVVEGDKTLAGIATHSAIVLKKLMWDALMHYGR